MRTLHVDVGTRKATEKPVSEDMKQRFTGGKGFGLKLLWDGTKATTKWNDPENEIVIAMGPSLRQHQLSRARARAWSSAFRP